MPRMYVKYFYKLPLAENSSCRMYSLSRIFFFTLCRVKLVPLGKSVYVSFLAYPSDIFIEHIFLEDSVSELNT